MGRPLRFARHEAVCLWSVQAVVSKLSCGGFEVKGIDCRPAFPPMELPETHASNLLLRRCPPPRGPEGSWEFQGPSAATEPVLDLRSLMFSSCGTTHSLQLPVCCLGHCSRSVITLARNPQRPASRPLSRMASSLLQSPTPKRRRVLHVPLP